ncbi:MAG: PBP1A family penicillin-binding protein [Patescibacteria group bacterium]|jgi:1A family penicillin-binding protein|nr:PBP1A family penicillin-binding protein [Patescibacteria group bacterium]
MPIPGLSVRTSSPQNWRKKHPYHKRITRQTFGKRPIYTGSHGKPPVNLVKLALILAAGAIVVGSLTSIILLAWIAKDLPNPDKIIDRSIALSTKIYDRTGENLLYDVHGLEKRTFVELPSIPKHLINATLTAEDRKFYEHKGISITGIVRSAIKNVLTGSKVGGSTLTQQLVKNAILTPEKKYTRKLKEIILSYQIEKKFAKDQILQMYFNEIPYGSVAYGAEAAAQTYFGKSVKDINLSEAAILAALPQAPSYYSPYGSHTDALFSRQQWILDSMAELGYITPEEAGFAKNEKVEFKKRDENILAPHFVMYVKEYLTQKYGELAVEQGGMKVITTLDLYKQEIAEEVVEENAAKNSENYNANNASLVALDPKTGQILAMVGSKNFFGDPEPAECTPGVNCSFDPQVNAAIRLRQPGSSFKPIVYTAAFKKGYTPETVLYDVETSFLNYDGQNYNPKNYDLKEHGPVTIRQALQGSLNIPAVKAIYLAGIDEVIDLAENLGYTTLKDRSRFGLSLVLGGGEVKLLEHVNAFATLAREGEWHPTAAILEVRDKDGNILEEFRKQEKKVLETEFARMINNVLSDNTARSYIFGENNYLTLGNRPVAAKTGTTNDYHDAWTIGHTPSLAVGVWVGNNNNKEMKRGADGSVVAAPIWNAFMRRVLGDTPVESFNPPTEITTEKPVLNGGIIEGVKVKIDKISGKLATTLTPETQTEEKTFRQVHSILHYINKDDPQGNTSPDFSDPQYQRWEEAIQNWAEKNNYISEEPPTEFDDLHTQANKPTIKITSPQYNQTINNRQIQASVSASAPRGVVRVEYYLNDHQIKETTTNPFDLNVFISDPNIVNGFYTLKAVVYDDIDNNQSDEIKLNFNLPPSSSALSWTYPTNNSLIKTANFPLSLTADLGDANGIQKIDIYYQTSGGEKKYINSARQFPDGKLLLQWIQSPESGQYQLLAEITNQDGFSYQVESISINIE